MTYDYNKKKFFILYIQYLPQCSKYTLNGFKYLNYLAKVIIDGINIFHNVLYYCFNQLYLLFKFLNLSHLPCMHNFYLRNMYIPFTIIFKLFSSHKLYYMLTLQVWFCILNSDFTTEIVSSKYTKIIS